MADFDLFDDLSLFRYFVRKLVKLGCTKNYYTTNQFANLLFGIANAKNMAYVSRIQAAYRNYFDRQGMFKKRLNYEKVLKDHPAIMDVSRAADAPANDSDSSLRKVYEMVKALEEEIVAIKQTSRAIKLDGLVNMSRVSDKYIFSANVNLDSDEELIVNEGALISLGNAKIQGAVLSYDQLNSTLYFECSTKLNTELYYYMEVDTGTTIAPVIDVLRSYERDGVSDLASLIGSPYRFPNNRFNLSATSSGTLDRSQAEALTKAIQNDITYIWGPPGTGKSHCLSEILSELNKLGEKTLVVSIANVAVDQLLSKVLTHHDNVDPFSSTRLINDGDISRIGYITEEPLVRRFDEAPSGKEILFLYRKIRETQERISNTTSQSAKAQLIAQKRELSRQVSEVQRKRIEKAKLLFTTATKALMDQTISATDFDNLVVDEASMMSIPYLYGLLKRVKKRVIIAGDFAQLSPISVSQTALAERYLKKDLFSLAGIGKSNTEHKSLSTLTVNRRATKPICELYNHAFYQGKMSVGRGDGTKGRVLYFPMAESGAEKTQSGSRKNPHSFRMVTDYVAKQLATSTSTIGIIAPYRAQVNDYKRYFKEQGYPKEVMNRIRIGTVHTFQGSEAEIIVFDTVDDLGIGVGRLFHHEQGERIVNVAVSRARDTLVVFGNLEAFYRSNKTTRKVLNVLNSIKSKVIND